MSFFMSMPFDSTAQERRIWNIMTVVFNWRLYRQACLNVVRSPGAQPGFVITSPIPSADQSPVRRQHPAQDLLGPMLRRSVRLRVSARGIKIIDQRGIDAVVADIIRRDGRLR